MIPKDETEDSSMCSSICFSPCVCLFKFWFGPLNWIIHTCLGTFGNFAVFAKELTALPVKFSFRWIFRIILLLTSIIIGIMISASEYYMFYYAVLPVRE